MENVLTEIITNWYFVLSVIFIITLPSIISAVGNLLSVVKMFNIKIPEFRLVVAGVCATLAVTIMSINLVVLYLFLFDRITLVDKQGGAVFGLSMLAAFLTALSFACRYPPR